MNFNLETFNSWIKRHKFFALSAPFVVLLGIYFITNSIDTFGQESQSPEEKNAYNNNLPNQQNELDVQEPNELYKKLQQDSLERLKENVQINNIVATKKQNDSLQLILEELNNFSLDDSNTNSTNGSHTNLALEPAKSKYVEKKTKVQEQLEYQKLLLEARDQRRSRSQDYTAPYTNEDLEPRNNSVNIKAAVYRDQFILPGNRVTLILEEDVYYNGNHFTKNTFVYATSNIQGSRVLLSITNINNIRMPLIAIDQQDGMAGLHNERAGELLQEFRAEVQDQGTNGLSEAVGEASDLPLAKKLVRSFGNFFKKRKYKQKDKILLVNGDRVFLTLKK